MNRNNPNQWEDDSSSREWSSGSSGGGRGEAGRGYSSDQVYGQGNPSYQRGQNREDYRNRSQEGQFRPRNWDDDRWSEYSDDEPRWTGGGYRESWQQSQGNRGRQSHQRDFGQHEYGRGFDQRHPRFGESRLASYGRDYSLPDYYGTSYEGQELSRLRAGYRPDEESRRYSSDNRYGTPSSYGGASSSPRFGNTYGGSTNYGTPQYGSHTGWSSSYGTSDARSAARTSPYFGKGPKGYSRSDDRIRDDVCERLTYDPDVDASDITVTVSQGEVTLAGEVEDRRAKRRAEDIIEDVPGVRDVHNQLRSRRGFFGSMVAEVTGKEHEENNVGKGPHTATTGTASTSPSSGTSGAVRNGGSAYR